MLREEPLSRSAQGRYFVPVALALLLLTVVTAAWLQSARPASAVPEPFYRDYTGIATVKVKNGAAWQQFPMNVCMTVETNGENGDITDVIVGWDGYGNCSETEEPTSVVDGPVLNNGCGCEDPIVGAFYADTKEDVATYGAGWKTPPTKQTASQWQFKLQSSAMDAADIWLNGDYRLLTPNTTFTVKFLRGRGGIYFKIAGFAPLNDNGLPKVTVEIESSAIGLDGPPTLVAISPDPWDSEATQVIDSDTPVVFTWDEPVTVDVTQIEAVCYTVNNGNTQTIFVAGSNLTVTGQGTNTITLTPVPSWESGGQYFVDCFVGIPPWAVDDVDTIDPPSWWYLSGGATNFSTGDPA